MQQLSHQDTNEEGMPSPASNHPKTALVNTAESEGLPVALLKEKLVQVRILVDNILGTEIEPQGLTGRNTKCKAEENTKKKL